LLESFIDISTSAIVSCSATKFGELLDIIISHFLKRRAGGKQGHGTCCHRVPHVLFLSRPDIVAYSAANNGLFVARGLLKSGCGYHARDSGKKNASFEHRIFSV